MIGELVHVFWQAVTGRQWSSCRCAQEQIVYRRVFFHHTRESFTISLCTLSRSLSFSLSNFNRKISFFVSSHNYFFYVAFVADAGICGDGARRMACFRIAPLIVGLFNACRYFRRVRWRSMHDSCTAPKPAFASRPHRRRARP